MDKIFSHPPWSFATNIYEVNIRQYTAEGTFGAFEKHLPRLKDMGVGILWCMPIMPISNKDRKGSLGSYYAIKDYKATNSEFGTIKDFKNLVKAAHELGLRIIIDWVANHTGNDNVWIESNPEFFCIDGSGNIVHPYGWEDVSKLDYDNLNMQDEMVKAMEFWIDECGIDGFRCDMAHLVPLDFWRKARKQLQINREPLFWLAECEEPNYHEVFDASYTWKWMHASEEFCKGQTDISNLLGVLREYDDSFAKDSFRVYFTSNHDENSWNGTEFEKYGDAAKTFAVFSSTWNGLPMIYSGQELPNYKRLLFFDKDLIAWGHGCALHDFYKVLLNLHKTNPALRAGDMNVSTYKIKVSSEKIFCFLRRNGSDEVLVLLNLSDDKLTVEIFDSLISGKFINVFNSSIMDAGGKIIIDMLPWDYLIFEKEKAL